MSGGFQPRFEIYEDFGSGMNIITFEIYTSDMPTIENKDDAIKIAKKHAIDEVIRRYGEGTKIIFEEMQNYLNKFCE